MIRNLTCLFVLLLSAACGAPSFVDTYSGSPYADSLRIAAPQSIPGMLEPEWYDRGGEDIAFHDSDSTNSGSGALNPLDGSYLHGFRADEAVDVSFTKANGIDDTPWNFVPVAMGQLYVGWTEPGEWTRYTVDVAESGRYAVGLRFTSRYGGRIGLSVDGDSSKVEMVVPPTFVEADSIEWRQYHHWNRIDSLGTIDLEAGRRVLTLHTIETGRMNYEALTFRRVE